MATLAERIAQFHQTAEPRYDHGGHAGMRWVIDGNALAFAEHAGTLDPGMAARVTTLSREALARHGGVLDERQHLGRVRQCHGDLHLRNIVLIDDEPTLFDGVEFNDEIACVDVLYDLAFLLMDLLKRDLPVHANLLFNRYLDITHDLDGLSIVPLFLSCRAAIRAKISASAAALQPDVKSREAEELRGCAREYLAMAEGLIAPARPVFVAVGGLSGSGKSTLAARLAPQIGGAAPGAIVLRSDVIRKSLFDQRAEVRLGPEAYTGAVTDRVYGLMRDRASAALAAGYAAVADAVYTDPQKRAASAEVARRAGVPFIGLWLDVPAESLERRLAQRRGDASDATLDVLRQQLATEIGPLDWAHIDASREVVEIERIARDIVDDVEPR